MLDQLVAADVVGRGRAPHAEQFLARVHYAYVAADDHAEREQTEQHADGYGRQLQPVERLYGRVLVAKRAVVEVQPEFDQNVLCTVAGRHGRGRQLHRGRRAFLLEHADLQFRVINFIGDLVQLSCEHGSTLRIISTRK